MDIVEQIEILFDRHGHHCVPDEHGLPLTARAHALQCAQLAEWDDAQPSLVAAALLHDVGHFIAGARDDDEVTHELKAVGLLSSDFDAAVTEPIRLHVLAKRFLASSEPGYLVRLPPSLAASLACQGGPLTAAESVSFQAQPFGALGVTLRRWDDRARQAGRRTPPLRYYLDIVESIRRRPLPALRLVRIGAFDIA